MTIKKTFSAILNRTQSVKKKFLILFKIKNKLFLVFVLSIPYYNLNCEKTSFAVTTL